MNTIAPPAKSNGKTTKARNPRKGAGSRSKNDTVERSNARAAGGRAASNDRPHDKVTLVAPSRNGRTVDNLVVVLDRAEVRLRIAWKYRAILDPALPQSPPFHAHAWTALDVLRPGAATAGRPSATVGLTSLQRDLTTLRGAVAPTTRPGDPARATMRFETPLRVTFALVDLAPEIIDGARSLQGRFPALTDAAIAEAESSLATAREAVTAARAGKVDDAVNRLDTADDRQLALDVLLDCVDHLRAAATTTLQKTRPTVGKALTASIEPTHNRATAIGNATTPVEGVTVGSDPHETA